MGAEEWLNRVLEMESYDPAQLPEIDRIEVLVLTTSIEESIAELRFQTPRRDHIKSVLELSSDDVNEIVTLWRALPSGLTLRCNFPRFGLRFYRDNQLHLECSICWHCNAIILWREELGRTFFSFNGRSETAKILLALIKAKTKN